MRYKFVAGVEQTFIVIINREQHQDEGSQRGRGENKTKKDFNPPGGEKRFCLVNLG